MSNIFIKNNYEQNIHPIKHYVEQMAKYLSVITGDSYETTYNWVKNKIQNKSFPNMKDPIVNYYERNAYGDRDKKETPLSNYILSARKENLVIAPTFTCYLHPKEKESLLVGFLFENVKKRSIAKKKAFELRNKGDMDGFTRYNNEQGLMKIYNNSLSGSFVTKSSVFHNPTAHSTLTSTTRCVASFGNTTNERMISGNRLYLNPRNTINNIISIITYLDKEQIKSVMDKYNLHYPTPSEAFDCIMYSAGLYWRSRKWEKMILELFERMDAIERAAVVYTGDLYHIRKHNDVFTKELITNLSRKVTDVVVDNPLEIVETIDEGILNLTHHICAEDIVGMGSDYKEMHEKGILNTLVATALNITETLEKYRDFIQTFLVTDHLPPDFANIKKMLRRTVVLSDTDSTCASYQDWVDWYCNGVVFNETGVSVSASVMTIATQTIAHVLRTLATNMNVQEDKRGLLAMKNEFFWDTMTPMNVSKHYFANVRIQEGNVLAKPELEKKGVHLISSTKPKVLIKDSEDIIKEICNTVASNKKLSLTKYIDHVSVLEKHIKESLLNGETTFYSLQKVKEASGYKGGEINSPYIHHLFWVEVMQDKYGLIEEPTYTTIKIPTILSSMAKIKEWLSAIEDIELRNRLEEWLKKYNKTQLNTIQLNLNYVLDRGIPDEIKIVIDTKRVILDLCSTHYMILESIGFYKHPESTLTEMGY